MIHRNLLLVLVLLIGFWPGHPANGQVLLLVDITDPNNVLFSATGNAPGINDSTSNQIQGITLIDLFHVDFGVNDELLSGNLISAGGSAPFDTLLNNFPPGVTARDLNLFKETDGVQQTFSTSAPAFTGTGMTAGLVGAEFRSTGDIIVGDTIGGSGEVLGQWSVIPEPSSGALSILALAALWAARRRKK